MPILLLNMLIAMMGNTYAIVSEKSEKEFLKQWARVIMSIERAVSVDQAKAYLEEYSMKMGENLRGVMVIKTKDKSRASQRKGAVANWKKTGKTVNKYLKKRRITGKQGVAHFYSYQNQLFDNIEPCHIKQETTSGARCG